jgi:UDP-3-O-[3-hydroxymyristoyl] glucosamine N-acyltransferase
MGMQLGTLVERLGGQLSGDATLEVAGIAPLDLAGERHLSFLSNIKLRSQAACSQAAALIVNERDAAWLTGQGSYLGSQIITPNPYAWFARAAQIFYALEQRPKPAGIHPGAVVAGSARIATSACIGPHVTIEDDVIIGERVEIDAGCFIGQGARIGDDSHLFANVTFHAGCILGQRGMIHSGAVIGTDGFGFANEAGAWIKIPQTGRVVMGDDVDIGANTTIDRGALADTVIGDGVKLDNQIQIGHNCQIGAHTAMAGCVGVAGSAKIGKYCTFGGAAMVLGHLNIVDNVHISSGSMVSRSILEAGQYTGFYPLAKNAEWEKSAAVVRNLASLRSKVRSMEKNIEILNQQLGQQPGQQSGQQPGQQPGQQRTEEEKS